MAKTYRTVQGDMWDSIAKILYESGMTKLLEANGDYADIVVFQSGITLVVPDWEAPKTSRRPPWRRS